MHVFLAMPVTPTPLSLILLLNTTFERQRLYSSL